MTKNHLRMFCKIGVDRDTVRCHTQMYPVRLDVDLSLPLLKKQDIRCDFRSGVVLKCCIGQSDRSHKFCPFCQIFTDRRVALIKCSLCGNDCDHSARSYLIKCFREKIIMDQEIVFLILGVKYLIITKWHVSDHDIKEIVRVCSVLKPGNADRCILVKLLGYPTGNAVQFHAIQPVVLHRRRHASKKVADSHGRLQNISALKSKLYQRLVHAHGNLRRSIKGIIDRGSCCCVLLLCKQFFQLRIFAVPVPIMLIKYLWQTAPADILRQDLLFLRCGKPLLSLDLF